MRRRSIVVSLLGLLWSVPLWAQQSVTPEALTYHSFGSRGSSYSTLGLGMGIYLTDKEPGGPQRYLKLLGLFVPESTLGLETRLGDRTLRSAGRGFEIALHDQWLEPAGKGAEISLRYLGWEASAGDNQENVERKGAASVNLFHMGWNGAIDSMPSWLVWFVGLDLAMVSVPSDNYGEIQIAAGLRTAFF